MYLIFIFIYPECFVILEKDNLDSRFRVQWELTGLAEEQNLYVF